MKKYVICRESRETRDRTFGIVDWEDNKPVSIQWTDNVDIADTFSSGEDAIRSCNALITDDDNINYIHYLEIINL